MSAPAPSQGGGQVHGITEYHHEESARVRKILRESRELEPKARLAVLNDTLAEAVAAKQLMLTESFSVLMGQGNAAQDFVGSDPRFDDGEVWDEVGFHRGGGSRFARGRAMTQRGLEHAREIGRWLAAENEYVIGSMENRVSYVVGPGVTWRAVAKSRLEDDRGLIHAATDALEEFREAERVDLIEQEWVRRQDRDGEAILRVFANADGPPRLRFADPADLISPSEIAGDLSERVAHALSMGIRTDPQDVQTVLGYYLRESYEDEPQLVPADTGMGILHVHHAKLNVDMMDPRGWPTYWPIRRNMARAEKLLRNMSYVAALQAAIALIRKHESGTKTEVEGLLDQHRDLTVTSSATGRKRRYTHMGPGTVIDSGPGVSYESPVSSVNAANNVSVLNADLGAGAAAVNQPRFMFSGEADGGYANQLVAEGPPDKNFKRLQVRNKRPLRAIHWDFFKHEVFWGRLDPRVLTHLRLEGDFPETQVRDQLQTTQRYQILNAAGVVSRRTWGAKEGLNPEEEQRYLDAEAERGLSDPRKSEETPGLKPPAGSTPGGPGGADYQGNPESPETTATQVF